MKWHKGPPPEIGWWPASADQYPNPRVIRWWDGTEWSLAAIPTMTAKQAAAMASHESTLPAECIQWTDRWWL